MLPDYKVELTPEAEQAYQAYYRRARKHLQSGNHSNAHVKTLRMIDEALDVLIPSAPLDPARALSGTLNSLYRVKKGRIRICYIASAETRTIFVLFISETLRKDGDKDDPYAVLTKLVGSGKFDELYSSLGLPVPKISLAATNIQ